MDRDWRQADGSEILRPVPSDVECHSVCRHCHWDCGGSGVVVIHLDLSVHRDDM